LILGDYRTARRTIYDLQKSLHVRDISAPVGGLDPLASNISGTVRVSGWSYDNVGVANVELFVEDQVLGAVSLGQIRPDVRDAWPGAPVNSGFAYNLDSKRLGNGTHRLGVRMADASGNVSRYSITVRVTN
jgi:hypothetical protein